MYHYKARAYSPGLGRFMQTDPIGYADGLNMYAYVGNDPMNGVDPLGLASVCVEGNCWNVDLDRCDGVCLDPNDPNEMEFLKEILGRVGISLDEFFTQDMNLITGRGKRRTRWRPSGLIRLFLPTHDSHYTRKLRCSASNGRKALKRSGAAPLTGPLTSDYRETTTINQPIAQSVNSDGTITNQTFDDHIFHSGNVTLRVVATGPTSSELEISGSGLHTEFYGSYSPGVNVGIARISDVAGHVAFLGVISETQRICSLL